MNTTNNIHVESGSQVGQISAGAIVYLDGVVTTFHEAGQNDFAAALKTFTQEVVDSRELSVQTRKELLDLLREVVEQLHTKKDERNPSILRLALQNIQTIVSTVHALVPYWEKLKQLLESLFNS